MQTLSDDARMSTQLEGKKLTGWGARFGQLVGQIVESAIGLQGSLELDDERGIQAEEIIFNDKGQEVEEKKKREAMRHASKMQKQGQKVSAMKKAKMKEGPEGERGNERERTIDERSDPKKEIEQIRDTSQVRGEALTEQRRQTDIAQGKDPSLNDAQQIREGNIVKEQALKAQGNAQMRGNDMVASAFLLGEGAKHLDRSQDQVAAKAAQLNSPAQGMVDLVKALLPVDLPDMRDKQQLQQQQQGGPRM